MGESACSSMVERRPDKTEVDGSIPSTRTVDARVECSKVRLIYECAEFLAVAKPSGMLTHPARIRDWEHEPSVASWAVARYPEIREVGDNPLLRPGIVHRLDRDTSGVLLIARTERSFRYLQSLFRERKMQKEYIAIVAGAVRGRGTLRAKIGIKRGTIKRSVFARGVKQRKEAITEYIGIPCGTGAHCRYSCLLLRPKTGRTHQIRVQLAGIGHPVLGDRIYGRKFAKDAPRLLLHASALEFTRQEGKRIRIEAALPEVFSSICPQECLEKLST